MEQDKPMPEAPEDGALVLQTFPDGSTAYATSEGLAKLEENRERSDRLRELGRILAGTA
jgi:hypothetical protein